MKLDELAKVVQEYFRDCDPFGDMLQRDRDLALKIARKVLEEVTKRMVVSYDGDMDLGAGLAAANLRILSVLAELEGRE